MKDETAKGGAERVRREKRRVGTFLFLFFWYECCRCCVFWERTVNQKESKKKQQKKKADEKRGKKETNKASLDILTRQLRCSPRLFAGLRRKKKAVHRKRPRCLFVTLPVVSAPLRFVDGPGGFGASQRSEGEEDVALQEPRRRRKGRRRGKEGENGGNGRRRRLKKTVDDPLKKKAFALLLLFLSIGAVAFDLSPDRSDRSTRRGRSSLVCRAGVVCNHQRREETRRDGKRWTERQADRHRERDKKKERERDRKNDAKTI